MKIRCILAIMLISQSLSADPVVHKFELWGKAETKTEKYLLFIGWTNGFIQERGQRGVEFAKCLEKITYDQALAMVDKYYKDHPEKWSRPFGEQILEALTVAGGPCEELHSLLPEPLKSNCEYRSANQPNYAIISHLAQRQ
jgi:hypothetical protein